MQFIVVSHQIVVELTCDISLKAKQSNEIDKRRIPSWPVQPPYGARPIASAGRSREPSVRPQHTETRTPSRRAALLVPVEGGGI